MRTKVKKRSKYSQVANIAIKYVNKFLKYYYNYNLKAS